MVTTRIALILTMATTMGCGEEEPVSVRPQRVSIPPEAVVASFGKLADSSEVEVLTWPRLARLSPSGRYLGIGDYDDPFLRVLDRKTGAKRSFGEKGRGPGELLAAYGLDFLGDSTLLVLNGSARLERFDTDGNWLGGDRLSDTGLLVSSVAVACGDRVFAYGVPRNHRRLDTVPWVHELTFDGAIGSESRLRIPGRGYRVNIGAHYGFDGNPHGLLLWHRAREPQTGYWLPCEEEEAMMWGHTEGREVIERRMTLDDSEMGGSALTLPDTLFQGVAGLGGMKTLARRVLEPADGVTVTTFHSVRPGGCREVEVVGDWTIHDAHADGLVMATNDPFPRVLVVDWGWLEGVLTGVACWA